MRKTLIKFGIAVVILVALIVSRHANAGETNREMFAKTAIRAQVATYRVACNGEQDQRIADTASYDDRNSDAVVGRFAELA